MSTAIRPIFCPLNLKSSSSERNGSKELLLFLHHCVNSNWIWVFVLVLAYHYYSSALLGILDQPTLVLAMWMEMGWSRTSHLLNLTHDAFWVLKSASWVLTVVKWFKSIRAGCSVANKDWTRRTGSSLSCTVPRPLRRPLFTNWSHLELALMAPCICYPSLILSACPEPSF